MSFVVRAFPRTLRALPPVARSRGITSLPVGVALEKQQNFNPVRRTQNQSVQVANGKPVIFLQDWTESQHTVRDAISQIMAKYDDEFWLACDKNATFPHQCQSILISIICRALYPHTSFVDSVTKDLAAGGWLGICMPEEVSDAPLRWFRACSDKRKSTEEVLWESQRRLS